MKRVLLTGAAGFIGRQCVPALVARGFEVHAVDLRMLPDSQPNVHWHRANLLDAAQVLALVHAVRPRQLLHLAWTTTPGEYPASPENLQWVEASIRLLETFARYGGQRVVVSGTCGEYDARHGCCQEGVTPLAPSTLYARCKHSLRLSLEAFSQREGLSSSWGRVFHLYGPYSHPARFPGSVIAALLNERIARCSHGNQIRDFLHVSDAADALVCLLASDVQGPVNVASGKGVRLKDMVYTLADLLGRRNLVDLGAIETPRDEPPILVADVRRLNKEVGWWPRYELEDGLRDTVDWWRRNRRPQQDWACPHPLPLSGQQERESARASQDRHAAPWPLCPAALEAQGNPQSNVGSCRR